MQQSLFIPDVQFPGLNDIIKASKAHPMAYSSMKHDWGDLVTALVKRAKLKPMQGKVSVHFNWIEKARRRDPDNIRAGSKFILDALVSSGVLASDSLRTIAGLSDTFTVSKAAGVWVTITTVDEM